MSGRPSVKSAFENLRPTILREPVRSAVSAEAEARLLHTPPAAPPVDSEIGPAPKQPQGRDPDSVPGPTSSTPSLNSGNLLQKKKRERLLLVSFRMPQSLKEKLEHAAKTHEINQTDLINEAIEINLQRYV